MNSCGRLGINVVSALLVLGAVAARAETTTQSIDFPSAPGWYFVSLQVDPTIREPSSVFPVNGGFAYDHIWSFDPVDGWRHYSPDLELSVVLNDLETIDPLTGYWLHVTDVPAGGFQLDVTGETVGLQRLEGAGWHGIGPLASPGDGAQDLDTLFADLGPAISTRILESWKYDRGAQSFSQIPSFSANCGTSSASCLSPGEGFWLRSSGDIIVGKELSVQPQGLFVTADQPAQRVSVSYTGIGPLAARMLPAQSGSGLLFLPAKTNFLDGVEVPEVDPEGGSADGPATEADLDGDGTPEPCPDLCAGAVDCVNLCFANSTQRHDFYVSIELETFLSEQRFSSLDSGNEYAIFQIDEGPAQEVLSTIPVAVKPPAVRGDYAGTLFYSDSALGEIPIQFWVDDCIIDAGTSAEDCTTTQVTAILNPTLLGSDSNGIDDDDDGETDEANEVREIRLRDNPGFSPETILHGPISSDNQYLRLSGRAADLPDLGFAVATCNTGTCSDGSGSCVSDADCPRDGGIASAFSASSRELTLEGRKISAETFAGTFSDRFDGSTLASQGGASATGTFVLTRVTAPQCVARLPGATESYALDILCRTSSDCPGYCTGVPDVEGLSCLSSADCQVTPEEGGMVAGTCERFTCGFRSTAPGSASEAALQHGSATIDVPGLDRDVVVEVFGPTPTLAVVDSGTGSVGFTALACGNYDVRITAPGCNASTAMFDPCLGNLSVTDFTCTGPPANLTSLSPTVSGGAFRLTGGFPLTDSPVISAAAFSLLSAGGESALLGPDPVTRWTNVFKWPTIATRVRSGLIELF